MNERYLVEGVHLKDSGDLVLEMSEFMNPSKTLSKAHDILIPKAQLDAIICLFKQSTHPPTKEEPNEKRTETT